MSEVKNIIVPTGRKKPIKTQGKSKVEEIRKKLESKSEKITAAKKDVIPKVSLPKTQKALEIRKDENNHLRWAFEIIIEGEPSDEIQKLVSALKKGDLPVETASKYRTIVGAFERFKINQHALERELGEEETDISELYTVWNELSNEEKQEYILEYLDKQEIYEQREILKRLKEMSQNLQQIFIRQFLSQNLQPLDFYRNWVNDFYLKFILALPTEKQSGFVVEAFNDEKNMFVITDRKAKSSWIKNIKAAILNFQKTGGIELEMKKAVKDSDVLDVLDDAEDNADDISVKVSDDETEEKDEEDDKDDKDEETEKDDKDGKDVKIRKLTKPVATVRPRKAVKMGEITQDIFDRIHANISNEEIVEQKLTANDLINQYAEDYLFILEKVSPNFEPRFNNVYELEMEIKDILRIYSKNAPPSFQLTELDKPIEMSDGKTLGKIPTRIYNTLLQYGAFSREKSQLKLNIPKTKRQVLIDRTFINSFYQICMTKGIGKKIVSTMEKELEVLATLLEIERKKNQSSEENISYLTLEISKKESSVKPETRKFVLSLTDSQIKNMFPETEKLDNTILLRVYAVIKLKDRDISLLSSKLGNVSRSKSSSIEEYSKCLDGISELGTIYMKPTENKEINRYLLTDTLDNGFREVSPKFLSLFCRSHRKKQEKNITKFWFRGEWLNLELSTSSQPFDENLFANIFSPKIIPTNIEKLKRSRITEKIKILARNMLNIHFDKEKTNKIISELLTETKTVDKFLLKVIDIFYFLRYSKKYATLLPIYEPTVLLSLSIFQKLEDVYDITKLKDEELYKIVIYIHDDESRLLNILLTEFLKNSGENIPIPFLKKFLTENFSENSELLKQFPVSKQKETILTIFLAERKIDRELTDFLKTLDTNVNLKVMLLHEYFHSAIKPVDLAVFYSLILSKYNSDENYYNRTEKIAADFFDSKKRENLFESKSKPVNKANDLLLLALKEIQGIMEKSGESKSLDSTNSFDSSDSSKTSTETRKTEVKVETPKLPASPANPIVPVSPVNPIPPASPVSSVPLDSSRSSESGESVKEVKMNFKELSDSDIKSTQQLVESLRTEGLLENSAVKISDVIMPDVSKTPLEKPCYKCGVKTSFIKSVIIIDKIPTIVYFCCLKCVEDTEFKKVSSKPSKASESKE